MLTSTIDLVALKNIADLFITSTGAGATPTAYLDSETALFSRPAGVPAFLYL